MMGAEAKVRNPRTPPKIQGIRLRLHYTCTLAFVLLAGVVATQLPDSFSYLQKAALGLATAALYLALLVLREYVLNLAIHHGKGPAPNVTLFAVGGVRQTTGELALPNHELLESAARFISSLAVAAVAYGVVALAINAGNATLASIAEWLAYIWACFFLLHLLPGFPLDAGMVLRAFLLKRSGSLYRATYTASTAGWVLGLLMIFGGVLATILTRQWLAGLVTVAMGWCLQSAAGEVRRHAALVVSLEPARVGDVMSGEYAAISPDTAIGQLLKEQVLVSGWRTFIVLDGAALKGVLTPRRIRAVSWKRWNTTRAVEAMIPLSGDEAAYLAQSGADALQALEQHRLEELPVVDRGRVIGVVTRAQLVNLGRARAEFKR
jgi:Zn-dependent protease